MPYLGKLIGVVAGYALLRHPLGALLGLALGHAFDAGWLGTRRRQDAPPAADSAYTTLGVDAAASDDEIDRVYRQLMSKYHPDKVAGAADEIRALAETRAREINAAYDRIRELRRYRR
ncbi:MAG: DnaJ domain-containing protein [Chiayiivirga sp.]|uniref:J domain-containing protein n=1 Tax=Chiayiivirga sp. TaxID=2041042 RepID=UPI0025C0AC22|nr:DnaJ domain-containing protein [Chiayiivirga sp.]MCI1711699.1 DnaJ domain-containing protein [Chiayiivirga sp.]MCI1729723.1 DnaJ domain-containing protein [Chiayiivirga sp.]